MNISQLIQLFLSFLQVGLFSVGGGYAAVPLIQNQVVDTLHWLNMNEFTDLLTIAEMTPGPIAINAATFVGIRVAGIPGAVAATVGNVFPSLIIVTLLGFAYRKYGKLTAMQTVLATLRPAITAVIACAFLTILLNAVFESGVIGQDIDLLSLLLFAGALFVIRYLKKNAVLTMIGCGVVYAAIHLVAR